MTTQPSTEVCSQTEGSGTTDSYEVCTQTEGSGILVAYINVDQIGSAVELLRGVSEVDLLGVIADLFQKFALTNYHVHIPSAFFVSFSTPESTWPS